MKRYSEKSETPAMEARSHSPAFLKKATKLAQKKLSPASAKRIRAKASAILNSDHSSAGAAY